MCIYVRVCVVRSVTVVLVLVLCCCAACGPQINALNETLSCSECALCLFTRPEWDRVERFWESFCISSCSEGRGASYYEWKAKGRARSQRVKTRESFFWHNVQNWLFFLVLKTCGKRLQTDFSVRQVPALPSAFTFTSLSVCSQPITSSLSLQSQFIYLSFSLSLFSPSFHQSDEFDTLPVMRWHTYSYLEEMKNRGEMELNGRLLTSRGISLKNIKSFGAAYVHLRFIEHSQWLVYVWGVWDKCSLTVSVMWHMCHIYIVHFVKPDGGGVGVPVDGWWKRCIWLYLEFITPLCCCWM